MEIESFAENVKENVQERLGKGYNITVRKVDRNNGVTYTGLCVTRDNESVSPIVYINNYYDTYKNGNATPADAADYVADVCRKERHKIDMRKFLSYENVRGSIVYKLVNTGKNRELLKDIPHMEFLDLSIVFQCLIETKEIGAATILIHNAHAKLWGVSAEELYRTAAENTPKLRGYEIKSMKEMLCEIIQGETAGKGQFGSDEWMEELECGVPMYVLSNKDRVEGAACILYPNMLKDFSRSIGGSFYIIPSSLHEVLLIPADNTDNCEDLKGMIREVNDTQLLEEEILSYSLYYYDAEMDEVQICI